MQGTATLRITVLSGNFSLFTVKFELHIYIKFWLIICTRATNLNAETTNPQYNTF